MTQTGSPDALKLFCRRMSYALLACVVAQAHVPLAAAESRGFDALRSTQAAREKSQRHADVSLAALPLEFEENDGQADAPVLYLARNPDRTVFLTSKEIVISLQRGAAKTSRVVRLTFNGSVGAKAIVPEIRTGARNNYYLGHDSAHWHADIPTFSRIRYRSVYAGIDAVYYGNGRELEYDLIVAPHANARVIDLAFDGADRIDIDADGD